MSKLNLNEMLTEQTKTEQKPFFARIINSLGRIYMNFNSRALPINADFLHEKAIKKTGLTDFGDPYYREGLDVLINNFAKLEKVSFVGRLNLHVVILRLLVNRLNFVEYKKRNPEVFEKPLYDPLLITGIARSGTTFLHRLLNEDGRWRSLKFYEVLYPIPPNPGLKDRRLLQCQKELKLISWMVSELDTRHVLRAEMPEECMWLMGNTFHSMEFVLEKPVYEYLEWYLQQDRSKAYQEYAQILQIFQHQAPNQRLLLKAPIHRGSLKYLYAAIPNLQIVITERNHLESLSSFSSLFYSAHINNVEVVDKKVLGGQISQFQMREEANQQAFLDKYQELNCRVEYEQIRQHPLSAVKKIYQHYHIPLTEETEEKMKVYARTHPQHKHGTHHYSPEEFGIQEENIYNRLPK